MAVFLIQVSGAESTHDTDTEEWWEEPIKLGIYRHSRWRDRPESEKGCWKKIESGDRILLYCTGSVNKYPKRLSHIFTVQDVEKNEKAELKLTEREELSPGMPLPIIREKIEKGNLSESMGACGTQGFNLQQVENRDLEQVKEWSDKQPPSIVMEELEERHLQDFLENNPDEIEEGLQPLNPENVMPPCAGVPDLLFKDKNENYLVVELKRGNASYHALGQVVSYAAALREVIDERPRRLIIADDFDEKIRFVEENQFDDFGEKFLELKTFTPSFSID